MINACATILARLDLTRKMDNFLFAYLWLRILFAFPYIVNDITECELLVYSVWFLRLIIMWLPGVNSLAKIINYY